MAEEYPTPIQPDDEHQNEGGEWVNLQGRDLADLINSLSREQAVQVLLAYRENMMPADEDFMAFIINNQNNDGHGSFDSDFNFNNCFTCICADCGEPAPEVRLTAGIDGTSEPFANCPNCNEITGVEFDATQILSHLNGEGSECDHQMYLRHFADSYTCDLEEWVAVLREERDFDSCRVCWMPEPSCFCDCPCITTDMGGRCVDCLRLVGAGRGDE